VRGGGGGREGRTFSVQSSIMLDLQYRPCSSPLSGLRLILLFCFVELEAVDGRDMACYVIVTCTSMLWTLLTVATSLTSLYAVVSPNWLTGYQRSNGLISPRVRN